MPSPETLERFIKKVESNDHVGAIEQFYAPDATMQENEKPPRVGREALMANERRALAQARSVHSQCVHPAFVHGDHVVIRWIFRFEFPDGSTMRMEELAYQRWKGDRIAEEKFFYDPQQMEPRPAGVR